MAQQAAALGVERLELEPRRVVGRAGLAPAAQVVVEVGELLGRHHAQALDAALTGDHRGHEHAQRRDAQRVDVVALRVPPVRVWRLGRRVDLSAVVHERVLALLHRRAKVDDAKRLSLDSFHQHDILGLEETPTCGGEAQQQIRSASIAMTNTSSAGHLHVSMDNSFLMDHVKGEEGLPQNTPAQFNLLQMPGKFTTPKELGPTDIKKFKKLLRTLI